MVRETAVEKETETCFNCGKKLVTWVKCKKGCNPFHSAYLQQDSNAKRPSVSINQIMKFLTSKIKYQHLQVKIGNFERNVLEKSGKKVQRSDILNSNKQLTLSMRGRLKSSANEENKENLATNHINGASDPKTRKDIRKPQKFRTDRPRCTYTCVRKECLSFFSLGYHLRHLSMT